MTCLLPFITVPTLFSEFVLTVYESPLGLNLFLINLYTYLYTYVSKCIENHNVNRIVCNVFRAFLIKLYLLNRKI